MKIAIVTDTHFGARNDNLNINEYFYKFYDNIFFPTLKERGITTCIHMGDVVDRRKYISYRIAHDFRSRFIERFREMGIDLHIIIGNHDTYYKNTNEINSMDELVGRDRVWIYSEPQIVEFDNTPILFIPWINASNHNKSIKFLNTAKTDLLMGHLEISGFQMYRGQYAENGYDRELFRRFDTVFSGHFHHKSDDGQIYYLGTPYQIYWNDYDDPRGFHIFDTETRELTFIQNLYRLFEKIYYDDENWSTDFRTMDTNYYKNKIVKLIVENKTRIPEFETFLDRLYKSNPIDLIILEDLSEYTARYADDEGEDLEVGNTATFLNEYVDSMPVDFEKSAERNKVKKLLQVIYDEALNTDE